jgi:acyl dehydratase
VPADAVLDLGHDAAEARKLLGAPLDVGQGWTSVASETTIRRFALAMGDDNPLWTDPGYAEHSRFGGLVAPPYFLQATEGLHVGTILTAYTGLYLGATVRFLRPVAAGTVITTTSAYRELEERATSAGDPIVFIHQDLEYLDAASGDLL